VQYAVGRAAEARKMSVEAKEDVGLGEEDGGGGKEGYGNRCFVSISHIFREVKWTDRQQKAAFMPKEPASC
jgi:hypothetical protein